MSSDNILNINDLEPFDVGHGENFAVQMAPVGSRVGMTKIGCNISQYPPGKKAFPMHAHRVNDELFYVMHGEGQIRIGEDTHTIKAGDFVGLPADSGKGHQIINTGTDVLKVLAISSSLSPDVVEYTDQGKIGVAIFNKPYGQPDPRGLRKFFHVKDAVDYWDGVED